MYYIVSSAQSVGCGARTDNVNLSVENWFNFGKDNRYIVVIVVSGEMSIFLIVNGGRLVVTSLHVVVVWGRG